MRSLVALGLLGAAATVSAHPPPFKGSKGLRRRTVNLDTYRLKATADYVNQTVISSSPSIMSLKSTDYLSTATALVKSIAPKAEFRVVGDHYVGTNGVAHVNFKQTAHGLDIDNADFNVNIGADGQVFSYGNNFFQGTIPPTSPLKRRTFTDPVSALNGATSILQLPVKGPATAEPSGDKETYTLKGTQGTVSDPEARLMYFVKADGTLSLTWRVETDIHDNWLLSYVDATTNKEIYGVVDYVAHAKYQVYPWGTNDPTEGSRQIITDPWEATADPFTWVGDGSATYNTTRGNNGAAQSNPDGGSEYLNNYRPQSADLDFSYPYETSMTPPSKYADASITQLFYTANMYHDVLYDLGFDEKAGNFETNNNGKGGVAGDYVILSSQDGSGTDNADFSTPPDGQNPRMRMYVWTYSTPNRDCCFESGVVIHEYTHGLSTRLTGGPANSNCLNALESGGMGEGWGDYMATAIRLKPGDTAATDYAMGSWVYNNPDGIRSYKYSTNLKTNPYTYSSVDAMDEVHSIGTVWGTMLYEVLWGLIAKHGKNDGAKPSFDSKGVPTDGKFLAMKLVMDGMALQPCNPNFVQARDAIIDADKALTGGANKCALWTAFAKRGLGSGAKYSSTKRTASTKIPSGTC